DIDISTALGGYDSVSGENIDVVAAYDFVGVVYSTTISSQNVLRMVYSKDNGVNWYGYQLTSGTSGAIYEAQAACYFANANSGKITLVYREYQSPDNYIRFKAYSFDGNSISDLSHNIDIDSGLYVNSESVHSPSIYTVAGTSGYKSYITWVKVKTSSSEYTLSYTTIDSGSKGGNYRVRSSSNAILQTSAVISNTGIIHVSWTEYINTQFGNDIYYSYSTDSLTFSNPKRVNLDLTSYTQEHSKLSLNGTHGPFIVWEDKRRDGNKYDVYFEDLRHTKQYSLETVFNVGYTAIPPYTVYDIVNYTDGSNNYYLVLGGVGKCTVIKYPPSGNPTVNTLNLDTGSEIYAMTIRPTTTNIIAVGKVGSNGGVWVIDPTVPSITRRTETWATSSGSVFYDVEWGYDRVDNQAEQCFLLGEYYLDNMRIIRIKNDFTWDGELGWTGKKPIITHDGRDYIAFRSGALSSYSMIYNTGNLGDTTWTAIISNLGNPTSWNINDAFTIQNGVNNYPTIYLACDSSGSWKSVYRVIRTGTTSAYLEAVPINGDFDSSYFNMKSVSGNASEKWALFVGENTYYSQPRGVVLAISRLDDSTVNNIVTDVFVTIDKNGFTACQVVNSTRIDDKIALICGYTSSPGVYYLNYDAYD
ncbi:MAG: hypothetical protein QXT63_02445, partial [Thermoplasmata archaeon]